MSSDPRWFTVILRTELWESLRDGVIRPAESEAIRAGRSARHDWLRDAWTDVEHGEGLSSLRLDTELAELLLDEIRRREPNALLEVTAALPNR